jgi:hypothetical protein
MRALSAVVEVARQTLRLQLQNRMFWLLAAALLGLAGIMGGVALNQDDTPGRQVYCIFCWWFVATVLLPWTTLYFSVQAVHGDIEDRTFQYLFVRPVPRGSILLGKWLAVALLSAACHALGVVLIYAAGRISDEMWTNGPEPRLPVVFAEAMVLLAVGYAAVSVFFAALFKRPLVWGTLFIVGGQLFLSNFPARAGIRLLTIADPVRRFVLEGIDPDQRLARMLWPSERNWSDEMIGQPLLNLGVIVGVALVLALVSYQRSEYDSRSRE